MLALLQTCRQAGSENKANSKSSMISSDCRNDLSFILNRPIRALPYSVFDTEPGIALPRVIV